MLSAQTVAAKNQAYRLGRLRGAVPKKVIASRTVPRQGGGYWLLGLAGSFTTTPFLLLLTYMEVGVIASALWPHSRPYRERDPVTTYIVAF
eukprot:6148600-Amphidinium_carterae.1